MYPSNFGFQNLGAGANWHSQVLTCHFVLVFWNKICIRRLCLCLCLLVEIEVEEAEEVVVAVVVAVVVILVAVGRVFVGITPVHAKKIYSSCSPSCFVSASSKISSRLLVG